MESQTEQKITSRQELRRWIEQWQKKGEEVVFTNGCFDIIHLGHIDYLEKAKNKGNRLIIAVNTDESVKRLKGENRPIVNEYSRCRLLAALEFVDAVALFEEDTPLEIITELQPDILVKGNDYHVGNIVGADIVLDRGGRVETIDLVEGYSTTNIIQKIKQAYS